MTDTPQTSIITIKTLHTEKLNGPIREFLMLRRAVDFLQAVPEENRCNDLSEALTYILNYYSNFPKTAPLVLEFRGVPGPDGIPYDSTEESISLTKEGVSIVNEGAQSEFNALKEFGVKVKTTLNTNTSLHPDEVNALSELKNYYDSLV